MSKFAEGVSVRTHTTRKTIDNERLKQIETQMAQKGLKLKGEEEGGSDIEFEAESDSIE